MNQKAISIGIESYKEIVDRPYYYVDKTLLIKDLLDNGTLVSCFTRPRRFGKTLALSMLKTFFELEMDSKGNVIDNSHYFEGMKIAEDLYEKTAELVREEINPRDSWRASKAFRLQIGGEIAARALRRTIELAGGDSV